MRDFHLHADNWPDAEINFASFPDARLAGRFRSLLQSIADNIGNPIPYACQDWAGTKAAYRFFANPKIDARIILSGHFEAPRSRFEATSCLIHILHDATEFSYHRIRPESMDKDKKGRAACDLSMHSSLVVSSDGVPLGLSAVKFGTSKKSGAWVENVRQSAELLGDAERCIHIADWDGDIFGLFSMARDLRTHFIIRKGDAIAESAAQAKAAGVCRVEVQDKSGNSHVAKLQVRYRRMTMHPPHDRLKQCPSLELTVIHASEKRRPKGKEPVEWVLITDLPVNDFHDAADKLERYALRRKIETYHKIMKSGCKAEESKLGAADRLICLLSIYCIVSWRIFWLYTVNRAGSESPVTHRPSMRT